MFSSAITDPVKRQFISCCSALFASYGDDQVLTKRDVALMF